MPRRNDATVTTNRRSAGPRASRRDGWSDGLLVGEPRQLGVDQEVRASRIERQRHAVGLDRHADLGGPAIVARSDQAEAVERNGLVVLDQEEPLGDGDRRGELARLARTPGPRPARQVEPNSISVAAA